MGKISSLQPENPAKQKDSVADHVSVLTAIRAYAIGAQQTNIITATDPPPDWFNTLTTNLNAAKKHSETWLTSIEPSITSTIPQAMLNIGSRFQVGSSKILQILTDSNYNPSKEQIASILIELNFIMKHFKDEQNNITEVRNSFTTFQTNANDDLTALTTGNNSIQNALEADQQIINKLNADITIQKANIAEDNAAITAAAIAAGIGLFVGVAVLGLGAAATGPFAPFVMAIGAFIIVAAIVSAVVTIAVYESKLADAQNALNKDVNTLSNEGQQVAALTIMNNSITSLVDKNKAMSQSLSDIADWFAILSTKMTAVITDINDAQSDLTQADWQDMQSDIQEAQIQWTDLLSFATQYQITVSTIENKIVNIHQISSAA